MMMSQAFFEELAFRNIITERVPYAVNIGCGDGLMYEDPVYPLYASGFEGVAIDAWDHQDLKKNLGKFNVVLRPATAVYSHNILSVLADANCPVAPSFLKIDIDGVDADILRAVLSGGIRPLAIQAEIHTEIPPPYAFSVASSNKYKPGAEHGFYGFSLAYGVDLLATYGYKLYKLDFETPWTHDGLWVHESVMARAGLLAIDPRIAFLERPAYLYHIEAAPKALVESWRVREDYETVRAEIWSVMLECCRVKHGHTEVPFELYISR